MEQPIIEVGNLSYRYGDLLSFVGIFSLGFLFLSSAIAISMETPEGLQGVITLLTMPIFFVSNALYPVESFPSLLKTLSLMSPPLSCIRNSIFRYRSGFLFPWYQIYIDHQ